jgi:hypothetical protein
MVAQAPQNNVRSPNTHRKYPNAYQEAVGMQAVIMQDILNPDTPKALRPRLVEAWDKLEDRKRVLRNRPLPGSLVHEKQTRMRTERKLGASVLYPSAPSAPYVMHDHATAHACDPQPSDFVPTEQPPSNAC